MQAMRHFLISSVLLSLGAAACSSTGSVSRDGTEPQASRTVTSTRARPAVHRRSVSATPTSVAPGTSVLPAPDGPFGVGVMDLPLPDSIAYYPARVNTGTGQHRYLDPKLLPGLGVPVEMFSTLTTTSRVGATPLPAGSPRPVVVLAPGFGSLIALSTSLAEHLASHGYVVVAVQPDLAGEAADMMPNEAHGAARTSQIAASLDMIASPAFARLVGPVDQHRIALGGHSYAGSIAFNVSLHDRRVAAVFDLDGRLFAEAATTPTKVPSLVVTSTGGTADVQQLQDTVRAGRKTVAVGLLGAQHYDLTDAPAIGGLLRTTGISFDVGTIGAVATSNTSAIVQRFLDAVLNGERHVPTAASLLDGLPSTTDHAFASRS